MAFNIAPDESKSRAYSWTAASWTAASSKKQVSEITQATRRPHACANLLDRRHQRKAEQHHPAHCIAELCPGLGISGDAAGVVVGGAGDQSRAKAAEQAFVRGAARGAAQGDAGRQHGNCPVISVGIGHWPAAAGLRARVFRG